MLLNIVGFQIGWFACVLGAAHDYPLLGPLVALPIIGLHLMQRTGKPSEIALIIAVAIIGSAYDQALLSLGLVAYGATIWNPGWLPIWMITLWLLFATTLNVSLKWLHRRYLIAALFGFLGGPLAYWGGAKLGAMQWLQMHALLTALAIGWAILMPVLVRLAAYSRQIQSQKDLSHV